MLSRFARNIGPYVEAELVAARVAKANNETALEFSHLENAHVLGQESVYWHTKVHAVMLVWGLRNGSVKEVFGQLIRIVGAFFGTAFGLVPQGNTGSSNVSAIKVMPLQPEHELIIRKAKKV